MNSSVLTACIQVVGWETETALKHWRDLRSCGYQVKLVPLRSEGYPDRYRLKMPLPNCPGISYYLSWDEDVRVALAERCYLPIGAVSPGRRSRWAKADAVGQKHFPEVH